MDFYENVHNIDIDISIQKKERKKAKENKTTATATATNKWNGPDGGTKTNCGKFLFSIEIISESIYVHSMP